MLNFKIIGLIAILFLSITVAIFVNRSSPPAPNPTYDKDALDAETDRITTHKPLGTTKSTLSYSNNGQRQEK